MPFNHLKKQGGVPDVLSGRKKAEKHKYFSARVLLNAPGRTRTSNLQIRSLRLYPIELRVLGSQVIIGGGPVIVNSLRSEFLPQP